MAPARAIGRVPLGGVPRLVAAGGQTEIDALAACADADVIEVRADLFDDARPETVTAALRRVRAGGRPVILTVRSAAEGGRSLDEERRLALYAAGLAHVDAIDVEIASGALVAELVPRARSAGRAVILSAHVLDAAPPAEQLLERVDTAFTLGADVAKLAAHARHLDDLRTLLRVTLSAHERGLVTLALGPLGPLSRLLLPAAGSLLTYGHVGRATAPGQMAVAELAALVRRFFPV
jgi:3-dehydroquinate dehydratase-1